MLEVELVRLDPDLPLPAYARPGDAGIDLVARHAATIAAGGGRLLMPTGVAVAIPQGYAGFVQPRSGLALRHGVTCLNTPGLIDSGYRGELKVLLINTDPSADHQIERGERIAQLVVQRVEHVIFEVVEALDDDSERGEGGFGHTGR
jgi:dUTP pyrophosphatase